MEKVTNWFLKYLETFDFKNKKEISTNPSSNAFSIKHIFMDFWSTFCKHKDVIKNGIRPYVIDEVKKMMECKDFNKGFTLFECPFCHNFTRVPFSCKSRFCNSCGSIYVRQRANIIAKKTLDVSHRHVVFTIDSDLRYYFKKDRSLLNCLFHAVENTLFYSLKKCGRKCENLTPGFILVLHTFGRDLKWNPHIHVLLTEGGLTNQGTYKHINFIHYEQLRKAFMKTLFDELAKHIEVFGTKSQFYNLKKQCYQDHPDGFYVYAPPQKSLSKKYKGKDQVVQYIIRYTGRPAMAQSRIEAYDKASQMIMYWYEPHDSDEIVHVVENVLVFIGKLIQHILPPHFKSIRYAGIYAAKDKKYREKKKRYNQKKSFQEFIHRFRDTIIHDFKRDPLQCSCGNTMEFVEIFILGQKNDERR